MTNATISRLGVTNATTDGSFAQDNELFLKVFAGEVLTAFEEANVFVDKQMVRTIDSGKSASFPVTWKANARYHVPGNPVVGSNQIKKNEIIINIDDLLIADAAIYNLDEAKSHVDYRQIYSTELGRALAREYDNRIARLVVKGARAAATVDGGNGGSILKNTNAATDASVLASMMFSSAQALDEKDVPDYDERFCAVRPAQYYLLVQNTTTINKDIGGAGAYSDGKVWRIAGLELVKSNHIPSTNVALATDGEQNDYTGDFTDTVAAVFTKQTVGTVKLMDLAVQMSGPDFNIMYQSDMMVGKYAMGHGVLRPETAVEISKAAA